MFSLNLESRILELAQRRGLLAASDTGEWTSRVVRDSQGLDCSTLWGPRLDGLIEAGKISRTSIESLAFELTDPMVEDTAGSWLGDSCEPRPQPEFQFPTLGHRYQDLQLLGAGATARVFKAFDTQLQRWVALKFLKPGFIRPLETALREARAQAQVEHPNVCRIYEVGEAGGQSFLAMELADGPSLTSVFKHLEVPEIVRLVCELAEGVHAAHQQGLIHLDIKLGNILLRTLPNGDFQPLITDFGMVRSELDTNASLCPLGTPPYSSPEQIKGEFLQVDRRSDVYSLGVVLYVLLTGSFPFEADRFPMLLEAIQNQAPMPLRKRKPELAEDLEAILSKCLQKDLQQRYENAQALAEDLQCYLDGQPVGARSRSFQCRTRIWLQQHRKWVVSAAGFLLVAAVAIGFRHLAQFNQRQGEWAQRFEQEVGELEAFLNRVYSQPYHRLDSELATARKKTISSIRQKLATGDSAAQGPGHYALGRACEMLQEPTDMDHFQKAWDLGFRSAPVRWEIAVRNLQSYSDFIREMPPDASGKNHLVAYYSDQFLKIAKRTLTSEVPQRHERKYLLVKTELAIAKGDYAEALRIFREEREKRPWDYQAWLDEASCHQFEVVAMAIRANRPTYRSRLFGEQPGQDDPEISSQIDRKLKIIEDLLTEALRLAPSCPPLYVNMVVRWHLATTYSIGNSEVTVANTDAWLAKGLAISPNNPDLLSLKYAHLLNGVLKRSLERGLNPTLVVQEFVKHLRQVDPKYRAHRIATQYQVAMGALMGQLPPVDWTYYLNSLDAGNGALPPEMDTRWEITRHPLLFDEHMLETGQDPVPNLKRVMDWATRCQGTISVQRYTKFMARGWLAICQYQALCGHPVETDLLTAQEWVRAYGAAAPNARLEKASLESWLVRLQCSKNPAGTPLQGALESLREALGVVEEPGPERFRAQMEFVDVSLALLRDAPALGQSPSRLLQDARNQAHAAHRFLPTSTEVPERLATISLLESRNMQNPLPSLSQGLAYAEQALVYPRPLSDEEQNRGLRRSFPVLIEFPHQSRTLMMRGELELELARVEKDPSSRRKWRLKAERTLREALEKNANLGWMIQCLLSEP